MKTIRTIGVIALTVIVCGLMGACSSDNEEEKIKDHQFVDLGLPSGTLWATCNIGANSPEEYGDYFAWGETSGYFAGKTIFDYNNYKWSDNNYSDYHPRMTKYNSAGKKVLDLEDDAAYVNWGANWCMPTYDQFKELIDKRYTSYQWTTLNGVRGLKIVSRSNDNYIFLPAAGQDVSLEIGIYGFYWCTEGARNGSDAYSLNFTYDDVRLDYDYMCDSWDGRSIRPVRSL